MLALEQVRNVFRILTNICNGDVVIISNVNICCQLFPYKVQSLALGWSRKWLCRCIQHSSLNSNSHISLKQVKVKSLYLKFAIYFSKHKWIIKTTIKNIRWRSLEHFFGKFLKVTIKVFLAELFFCKVLCFQEQH